MSEQTGSGTSTYGKVWANREARGLLIGQALSELGDQAARVAIALLVLQETGSALYSALVLALTYLPGFLGAAALSGLADRLPRRTLMIVCDLIRAALMAALVVLAAKSSPLVWLFAFLLVAEFVAMPFGAARGALYPDVLTERNVYVRGQALSRSVHLITQVVGAVVGGALVGWLSPAAALAVDCASFLLSALLVTLFVRRRPAPDPMPTSPRRALDDAIDGTRELFRDPVRRSITLLGWGAGLFLVAPEAVALAYRPDLAPVVGGVLLAAVPAGSAVGALMMPRLPMRDQLRLLLPLAALSALPLFATSIDPPPLVAGALWFVAGFLQAFVLTVISAVTLFTAPHRRGRVMGVAAAGFNIASACSFALVGYLATLTAIGPARAVSLAGAGGLVLVAVLRAVWPSDAIARAV